ncbi:TetR/AcrR family transcriptional regulator [Rhodococcus sp. NPDC003318]|uniref:TetR/AcrR family transcriptional regulator n=1 Tax=Rhodococcus sp. NPDC003318 TaxID=3364503 RepID=UPI0036898173
MRKRSETIDTDFRSSAVQGTDDATVADVINAAVRTWVEKGYHGTSVRDLAAAAGVSVGTLYNHVGSKHDLLVLIMNRVMDGLVTRTEDVLFRAGTDPAERLRAIVGVHVEAHAARPYESMLGNTELRSLEPAALALVVSKRDAQQRMFDRVVADGVDRGSFTTTDPVNASRFVVSACTAVATWFRPGGSMSAADVVDRYQRIALDAVGYRGAVAHQEEKS